MLFRASHFVPEQRVHIAHQRSRMTSVLLNPSVLAASSSASINVSGNEISTARLGGSIGFLLCIFPLPSLLTFLFPFRSTPFYCPLIYAYLFSILAYLFYRVFIAKMPPR